MRVIIVRCQLQADTSQTKWRDFCEESVNGSVRLNRTLTQRDNLPLPLTNNSNNNSNNNNNNNKPYNLWHSLNHLGEDPLRGLTYCTHSS